MDGDGSQSAFTDGKGINPVVNDDDEVTRTVALAEEEAVKDHMVHNCNHPSVGYIRPSFQAFRMARNARMIETEACYFGATNNVKKNGRVADVMSDEKWPADDGSDSV